jgi:hypothetical protein
VADLNGALARSVAASITASGGHAIAIEMDASRWEDIRRMVTEAVDTSGFTVTEGALRMMSPEK